MNRLQVSEGLGLMFWATILGLFSIIPFLGIVASIAAFVLYLMGILKLRNNDEHYQMVLYLIVANFIVGLFGAGNGMLGTVMGWISAVINCGISYMLCMGTSRCVQPYSYEASENCISVRNLYIVCTVISLAAGILSVVPLLGFAAIPLFAVALIAELIADIRFLIMIWRCKEILR